MLFAEELFLRIRFWGTRGSIASAGRENVRFGGNTSCVQLQAADYTQIVLDCGTGARALGRTLLADETHCPTNIHVLTTHTHWDHIQGFPFFDPVYREGIQVSVYGPAGLDLGLESALAGQMQHTYFPVHLSALGSRLRARELGEGAFSVGSVRVRAQYLNHTAPTLGYRLEVGGVSVVYATDHEPFWWAPSPPDELPDIQHPGDRRHVSFLERADVVIHDAQYLDEEYAQKRGWGHSTVEYVVDLACLARASKLVLFHHDPDRSDEELAQILIRAQNQAQRKSGGALEVLVAAEGTDVLLEESAAATPTLEFDPGARRMVTGRRVIVAASDPNELVALNEALSPDGHLVRPVSEPSSLVGVLEREIADLVLYAVRPSDPAPEALVEEVRRQRSADELPVLLISGNVSEATANRLLALGTDLLFRPYGAPMLRARVRAWLARLPAPGFAPDGPSGRSRVDRRAQRRDLKSDVHSGVFDEALALQSGATERAFSPGDVLFREGDPSDGTYVLLDGTVRVLVRSREGPDIQLAAAGPGDTMGELGALDGGPRSATAIAETEVRALFLRREAFLHLLRSSSEQALRFMRVLASRLRAADRQLVDLASAPIYTRMAKRLLELKDERSSPFEVAIEDLAEQVAAAPHEVRPVLRGLERLGALRLRPEGIEIVSLDELRALLRH